jgi:phosphoribosylanthranilate isomerase
MTAVKVCGLTRPGDARAAVAAGAALIGLVFAPSPRRVTVAQARAIIAVLPPQIVRVGVFVDADPAWVARTAVAVGLDRLQFNGGEDGAYLAAFRPHRILKALRVPAGAPTPRRDPAPRAGALLVDAWVPGLAGGTGRVANWAYARTLKRFGKPLVLSGGLTPANVGAAIRAVRPDVVDVSSGVETRPGIKSAAKVRAFLRAVRAAG